MHYGVKPSKIILELYYKNKIDAISAHSTPSVAEKDCSGNLKSMKYEHWTFYEQ